MRGGLPVGVTVAEHLVPQVMAYAGVADLLSRPVLIGYPAGAVLIMMVDQLPRLTGVKTSGSELFPQLWSFIGVQ